MVPLFLKATMSAIAVFLAATIKTAVNKIYDEMKGIVKKMKNKMSDLIAIAVALLGSLGTTHWPGQSDI